MSLRYDLSEYQTALAAIAQVILNHSANIAIVAHIDPDGDAVGSCLGLQRALRQLGKSAQSYLQVPRYLKFLAPDDEILPYAEHLSPDTLLIVLDVDGADVVRVAGLDLANFQGARLNIDHHGTNVQTECQISLVVPEKASATQMVFELLPHLGVTVTADMATPLYTGLMTDTGFLRFSNTTPAALRTAADLLEQGAELTWLSEQLNVHNRKYYPLLSRVMSTVTFGFNNLVISAHVTQSMLDELSASWEDIEALVGMLRSAEGTVLAVLVKDYGSHCKFSMRSRAGVSAQNIAVACGGGGHVPAAGATIQQPYNQARPQLDAAIIQELQRCQLL